MRPSVAIPAALTLALFVSGCGTANAPGPQPDVRASAQPETEGQSRGAPAIEVVDTAFEPTTITIKLGETVRWRQTGVQPHSVTASDGSFDSSPDCSPISTQSCLSEGGTFAFVPARAGTYTYYCRVHGLPDGQGMSGTLVVS